MSTLRLLVLLCFVACSAVAQRAVALRDDGSPANVMNKMAWKRAIGVDHVIDVRDYGAKGDTNTDDTVAIKAAISAWTAAGEGAKLFFPAGDYIISDPLVINTQNKSIEGSGILTTLRAASAYTNSIMVFVGRTNAHSDNITIRNLFFIGSVQSAGVRVGGQTNSVWAGDGSDYPVTTINFHHTWHPWARIGVHFVNAYGCGVYDGVCEGIGNTAIGVEDSGRITVTGTQFYNVYSPITVWGNPAHTNYNRPNSVLIHHNTVTLSQLGIASVQAGSDIVIDHNTGIELGRMPSAQIDQHGIYLAGCSNVTVSGNVIRGTAEEGKAKLGYGIFIDSTAQKVVLSGNVLTSSNFVSGPLYDGANSTVLANAGHGVHQFQGAGNVSRLRVTFNEATNSATIDAYSSNGPPTIRLTSADEPRMILRGDGLSGIGKTATNPAAPLDVQGEYQANQGVIRIQDTSATAAPTVTFYDRTGSYVGVVGSVGTNFYLANKAGGWFYIQSGASNVLTISDQGNVRAGGVIQSDASYGVGVGGAYRAGATWSTNVITGATLQKDGSGLVTNVVFTTTTIEVKGGLTVAP